MKVFKLLNYLLPPAMLCMAGVAVAWGNDDGHPKLLALGDSVAFGYIASAGYEYVNPTNFLGYPSYVADQLGLEVVNAACPGETTGHFLSLASLPDLGCKAFRAEFPLHVAYASSQLAFATGYLKSHHDIRLITITLGANDGFLIEDACGGNPSCIVPQLPAIGMNIATILSDLRATGYDGAIIVTNYYSTDYTDLPLTELTAALNAVIAGATSGEQKVAVADVFTAFGKAAAPFGATNTTCAAGLLNVSNPIASTPPYTCDVHPTLSGQRLIADTIRRTYQTMDKGYY